MPPILRWLLRLGPTNPVAVRVVQNGSRRAKHLYIRAAYLAVLILVLLWSLVAQGATDYRELAAVGASSFTLVAYLQIAAICILAPVFMAGAIAQEASPRTWEIMLTTPMSASEIVLGNLFGRLFFILALLVASLPLFALTQYFGGVPGRTIFASYAVAAAAALLVGSIAIALAVSRLVGKRAVFTFYIAVVSYLALTAAADFFIRNAGGGAGPAGNGVTWMTSLNPFLALQALLNPATYPRAAPGTFTGIHRWAFETPVQTWIYGSVALSALLMLASTLTVRAGGLSSVMGAEGGTPWHRRLLGLGGPGSEHRAPRHVWHNPIAWREAAALNATLGRILSRWAFIAVGALWGIALVVLFHRGVLTITDFRFALVATLWTELAVTTLVAVNMAATAVTREREDGTLDLLLTTAITPSSYLTGKLRGLIAYLLPMLAVPLGTLALASLYVLTGGLGNPASVTITSVVGNTTYTVPAVLPEAALLAPLVVVPFIAFVVMVGLQWSLKSKGTLSAVVTTVSVVGIAIGVLGLCGWQAASDVRFIGPALAGLSPVAALRAMVFADNAMIETNLAEASAIPARIALAVGCVAGAIIYAAVVYGIHANMTRTFDMTVRRLAGVK